jgi:hypothetical protein
MFLFHGKISLRLRLQRDGKVYSSMILKGKNMALITPLEDTAKGTFCSGHLWNV